MSELTLSAVHRYVAWSGDRQPDPKTGQVPPFGSTVDVNNAAWTNTIGATVLTGYWQDPDFKPAEGTPLCTRDRDRNAALGAYDAARFRIKDHRRQTGIRNP